MRERRRCKGGRPARKEMSGYGRQQWAGWLQRIIAKDFVGSRSDYVPPVTQSAVARALAIPPQNITRLLKADRGLSPQRAWEVGESLQKLPHRQWCCGPLSLAAADTDFQEHLIGWLGTLLSDASLRRPFLERRTLRCLFALTLSNVYCGVPEMMRPNWVYNDIQRRAANIAWSRWWSLNDCAIDGLPPVLQAALLQLRVSPLSTEDAILGRGLSTGGALRDLLDLTSEWLHRRYGLLTVTWEDLRFTGRSLAPIPVPDPDDPMTRSIAYGRSVTWNSRYSFSLIGPADAAWKSGTISDSEYLREAQKPLASGLSRRDREQTVVQANAFINTERRLEKRLAHLPPEERLLTKLDLKTGAIHDRKTKASKDDSIVQASEDPNDQERYFPSIDDGLDDI
jgi:hypothetical protein